MRHLILGAAALVLASTTHAQTHQPDAYVQRIVPVGAFDQLEVSGPFKVIAIVSDEAADVRLLGPPALLTDTVVEVAGDTLKIHFREGARWSWNPGSGVNIAIIAPTLRAARIHGAADVEISNVKGKSFSAATSGSGGISLHGLNAEHGQFAATGAGGITVEGKAREGAYSVAGSGSIDAKRLRVQTASIAINGSGSIYADVARTVNISVGGSGTVDVVGGATCTKLTAQTQQVECR